MDKGPGRPSALAQYIADKLTDRHESGDEFARRIGVNASGLHKLLRGAYGAPQQRTLEKIAAGLGMSAGELLAAVEAQGEVDPIEQAIRQRLPEMREVLRDIPRPFWSPVVKSTFDRAIEGARDVAELFSNPPAEPPVRRSPQRGVRRLRSALNGETSDSKDDLANASHPLQAVAA